MELRTLESLVTLAEELHFGRAAERLFISQPALSKQIRNLEDEMGIILIERTQRHVALTSAGEVLVNHARSILGEVEASKVATMRAAQGKIGELTLSFTDSALYSFLPKVIRMFRQRYPDVDLKLFEGSPAQQVEQVQSRVVDTAMTYFPVPSDLCHKIVHEEAVIAVVPDDHRLAHHDQISIQDLADQPFISHPPSLAPELHAQVVRQWETLGFRPNIVQEAASKQTIVSLVAAGIGVAMIPESLKALRRDGVTYLPLQEEFIFTTIAVWHPDNHNPTLTNFLAII